MITPKELRKLIRKDDVPVKTVKQLELRLKKYCKLGFTETTFYLHKDNYAELLETLKKSGYYCCQSMDYSLDSGDDSRLVEIHWGAVACGELA